MVNLEHDKEQWNKYSTSVQAYGQENKNQTHDLADSLRKYHI